MADGGGDLGSPDGKIAEVKSPVVRKPSRRSPTTGHIRRKKTDLKRSQSSPREAIVPTSSDDEGRSVPVRRKSLSPGPGPEPKKVLRRRHRVKEKSLEPKEEASNLDNTTRKDIPKTGIIKKPFATKDDNQQQVEPKSGIIKKSSINKSESLQNSEPKSGNTKKPSAATVDNQQILESKTGSIVTPAVPKSNENEIIHVPEVREGTPKKTDRRKSNDSTNTKHEVNGKNNKEKFDDNLTNDENSNQPKTDGETDKACDDVNEVDKSTRPNSWWGGWLPFKRKEAKAEPASDADATGDDVDPRGEDYITTDDETAAEFVRLLSGANKAEIKAIAVIPRKLSLDDENTPLLRAKRMEEVKSWRQVIRESRVEFVKFMKEFPKEIATLKKLRNRCFCELLIMFIFCGCGAFVFKTTEGSFESFYKCGVKRVKRDFIDDLWRSSHYMKEEDWKSKARSKLWLFENQLQEAFEAGINTYSGQKSWSFINGVIYCLTVVTTIGYGHIAPVTNSGRALTIAYSIIGIPLFLILLADFGKLFTRCIKFLWAFVRRLYYTGSCKKVRRTGPVQEVMKGVQMMYDTIRRPSMFQVTEGVDIGQDGLGTPGDAPSTPAMSAFAIDDEFNLPISVAISILLVYIFMGATVFWCWEEDWTFFESFYFVFISMSTIGFGDLVPKNQMYMMLSIVYLAFGLALTSMCINVVQEKLSDTFRKASAKIGATIGLKVSDDDGTISPVSPTHVEIAEVHKSKSLQSMPVS